MGGSAPRDDGVKSLGVSMSTGGVLAVIWLIMLATVTVRECLSVRVCLMCM